MTTQRVLIVGATGFVGLRLHRDLLDRFAVTATFRGTHPDTGGVEWIEFDADRDDPSALIKAAGPDAVVHLLAVSRTEACARDPETAGRINTRLTEALGRAAKNEGKRFIFTSTDQVFDGAKGSYSESDPPTPTGVYARTKVAAEESLGRVFSDSLENLTILRLALSYGHSDEKHPGPVGWIVNALRKNEPVQLFHDEIRSPLYVGDVSRAVNDIVLNGRSGLYHLGGSDSIDRHSFGVRIAEKLGLDPGLCLSRSVKDYPGPEPRSPNCSFNVSKFIRDFGWTPIGVEEGLERILGDNS